MLQLLLSTVDLYSWKEVWTKSIAPFYCLVVKTYYSWKEVLPSVIGRPPLVVVFTEEVSAGEQQQGFRQNSPVHKPALVFCLAFQRCTHYVLWVDFHTTPKCSLLLYCKVYVEFGRTRVEDIPILPLACTAFMTGISIFPMTPC